MKTNSIETIRNGLLAQLDELDVEFKKQQTQLSDLKVIRRQVSSAIKALGGTGLNTETSKPAPNKKQVRLAIDQLLSDNQGQIAQDDISGLVAQKLATEQGCSAMGLALRVREVLATNEYLVEAGMVNKLPADAC